jgi:chemotaxis protein CheX
MSQTISLDPATDLEHVPSALIEGVTESVLSSFRKMIGSCEIDEHDPEKICHDCIVGIISFVGTMPWSMVLAMPKSTATEIVTKFVGMEIEFDSPDMGDVIGELANVLAGVVSGNLEKSGITAQMSLPTVARGHDVEFLSQGNFHTKEILFNSNGKPLWVKIVTAKPHKYFTSNVANQ